MSKATLAFGGAIALLIGIPVANLVSNGFARATAALEPPDEHTELVDVYVGALCEGGGMRVAGSWDELQTYGCRDQWYQQLTRAQVEQMLP